jgi:hypothetical protein
MEWVLENTCELVDRSMPEKTVKLKRFYPDAPLKVPRDYENPSKDEIIIDVIKAWNLLKEFRKAMNVASDHVEALVREKDDQERNIALMARALKKVRQGLEWEFLKTILLLALWETAKWIVKHPNWLGIVQ